MTLNIPPNRPNTRFFQDSFARFRPALTFAGFDNQEDHHFGYGLKQVIELSQDGLSLENRIIKYLHYKATRNPRDQDEKTSNAKTVVVNHNSQILQNRSFIALLTLILEENKCSLPGINMVSHQRAMEMLRASLLAEEQIHPLYANEMLTGPDRVKWTTSLSNMSRGLDLYFALENAYEHYNKDQSLLLTREEKSKVLARHILAVSQTLEVVDSNVGIGAFISGNWSLKMWSAAVYACLGTQHQNEAEARQLFIWFGRGLRRSGPGDTSEKRRYWTYMSSREVGGELKDCQRTWAEGPYYLHFTLQDVIPLWHAIRAQGYLEAPEHDVNIPDPFHSPWFTEPINWLADITTHAGETPPFDDGNRRPIFNANLMAWSALYGDASISMKMNWILQKVTQADAGIPVKWKQLNTDVLLVQLAMPKAEATVQPTAVIGNKSMVDRGEEQLIIRRTINNKNHFICLHGEPDIVSIERGEGHEQPDQMQLLYYLDAQSLIMDAGYDRGFVTKNSSWNRYTDHNVMAYASGDSGMESPNRFTKSVNHSPVDFLYIDALSNENLYVLKGQTWLKWRKGRQLVKSGYRHEANGQYKRTVIFVADEQLPYLIDINQVYNEVIKGDTPRLSMRYHVESNEFQGNEQEGWYAWMSQQNPNLYLFFDTIEHQKMYAQVQLEKTEVEERFRSKTKIQRFTYQGKPEKAFTTVGIFRADQAAPQATPAALATHTHGLRTHQIWQWDNKESGTVDILLVRSLITPEKEKQTIQFDINPGGEAVMLTCFEGYDVGYARCKEIGGKMQILSEYLYGLTPTSQGLFA